MVGIVVGGHRVGLAVESELALGDPVGDPSDGGAEIRRSVEVLLQVVEAKDDVGHLPIAVGRVSSVMMAPYVITLTTMPLALVRV